MRALGASRTSVATGGILGANWARNPLWKNARAVPSLDLRFAENKSLTDAKTGASLVDFTRASIGTFVGSDGLLQSAVTNLLLRSAEFDNASWTKQSSVSVSANTTISPDGALTADTVTADQSLGIFQSITATVGTTYTNSVYIKAGTATSVMLRDDTGAGRHIVFNPSTGVITATSGTLVSSGSQALNDGWYRYFMTYVADATTVRGIIRPNSAGSAQTFIAWGAQIEAASTVGEYIPTTSTINSAPRFDHNPTTGESLGLLVEEARTNLILQSEDFSAWTQTGASITVNTATAPDGTTTADLWTNTTSPGILHQLFTKDAVARTYTGSLWVKPLTGSGLVSFSLSIDDGGSTNRGRSTFNLLTGVAGTPVNDGNFSNTTSTMTRYPNNWYRLILTTTTSTGTSVRLRPFFSFTGATVNVWGGQIEEGSFATSYIPTTTATVTRAADVASITGTAFNSFYNQTEGTIYASYAERAFSVTHQVVTFSNGTANERISLAVNTSNILDVGVISGGTDTFAGNTPTLTAQEYQIGFGYKADNSGVSANGSAITVDSAVTLPTVSQLDVGARAGSSQILNSTIKRITYWPVRLANPTLQAITQP